MSHLFRKSIRTTYTALALAVISGSTFAAPAQDIIDARQETQIWTTYALSPYLRANNLNVTVHEGKATLTGTVEEDVNKDLAKQIALGVKGIKDVDNQIQVEADYQPTPNDINYGEVVDDASISAVIKSKLLWSKTTENQVIDVTTRKGKVTLSGSATSDQAKDMAKRLATGTHGVVAVVNNIKVTKNPKKDDTAKAGVHALGNNISDAWITTKVKSTFLYSSNVKGSAINVVTKAGVVTLSGNLDSGVERALATELAQNIRGVKNVVATDLVN